MNILIVDDTPDNVLLLKGFLKNAGYSSLHTATCAKEAFEQLTISGSGHGPAAVDLILMDIMMPEISGIEACQTIKASEHCHDIPIIMVTAKTDLESLQDAFSAGAMDYIIKPINKVELLARVRSALKLKTEMDCRKLRESELKERNEKLENAMQEINTLRGLIPICASCKNIRNIEGCWEQIEIYIQDHADVKFSHGMCDSCVRKQYPEIYAEEEQE